MNPLDLSAYITTLLRSGPEVITSFLMGVFLTAMLVFTIRHWIFRGRTASELARKDADIARKDAEVARKDVQIARVRTRLAGLEVVLSEKDVLVNKLRQENATLAAAAANNAAPPADYAAALGCATDLEAENRQLHEDKQSLEHTIAQLRTELAQVSGELAHSAKWLKVFDEENARLAES